MRAFLVALVLVAAVVAGLAAPAPAAAQTPDVKGFDHASHAAGLERRGKKADCVTCHPVGKEGQLKVFPDKKHRPCADAGCHSPWPLPPSKQEAETYCLVCHRKSDVEKGRTKPFYPPYDVNPEHTVAFPHARHAIPGASGTLCAACHPGHGEPAGGPTIVVKSDAHRVCSGCHERGAAPSMTTCNGCHKPIASVVAAPRPAWNENQVTHRFSHAAHARKVPSEDGRKCSTCHESLASARDGQPIPRPKMETCAKCHDGKQKTGDGRAIFAATGATCNRCHALPSGQKPGDAPKLPEARFSHAQHQQKGVDTSNCTRCHVLDARFMPEPVGKGLDHAPCADAGCHRPEFFSASPQAKICGTCHLDARPFAPARFAGLDAGPGEFGRDFSHLAHVQGLGAGGGNAFCGKCHQGRFEERPAAQSHAICAPCHGSGATPAMSSCNSCHALGAARGTLAARDPSFPWYVRATFEHEDHVRDPRSGGETPCLMCHDQVAGAKKLSEIGRPKMQQCDACHDGKSAFKTTGFGCWRCHTKAKP